MNSRKNRLRAITAEVISWAIVVVIGFLAFKNIGK